MTKTRTISLLASLALMTAAATVAAPSLASGPTATAANASVTLKNIRFSPASISISRGATVTWRFRDGHVAHNVSGKGFHSSTKSSGTFSHRFTNKGTYHYVCTLHPGMKGTITVH